MFYTIRIDERQRRLITEALMMQQTPGERDEVHRLLEILMNLDANEKANPGAVHQFALEERENEGR